MIALSLHNFTKTYTYVYIHLSYKQQHKILYIYIYNLICHYFLLSNTLHYKILIYIDLVLKIVVNIPKLCKIYSCKK